MKIYDVEQGSTEWLALRAGIPTASEFSRLVTPKKREIAKGEKVRGYVAEKLAERWLGRPLEAFSGSFSMEQGKILEEEAIPRFELETGLAGRKVGFITTDDGKYGCSPDWLLDIGGVEAKCPKPETHVEYLLAGTCPDEYYGQIQGSMLVTGAPHWYFVSYCRGFPLLIVKVMRDEEYLETLAEALQIVGKHIDEGYAVLVKLNGGEPVRAVQPEKDYFEEFYAETPTDLEEVV